MDFNFSQIPGTNTGNPLLEADNGKVIVEGVQSTISIIITNTAYTITTPPIFTIQPTVPGIIINPSTGTITVNINSFKDDLVPFITSFYEVETPKINGSNYTKTGYPKDAFVKIPVTVIRNCTGIINGIVPPPPPVPQIDTVIGEIKIYKDYAREAQEFKKMYNDIFK